MGADESVTYPACGHDSEKIYRCQRCGRDLADDPGRGRGADGRR